MLRVFKKRVAKMIELVQTNNQKTGKNPNFGAGAATMMGRKTYYGKIKSLDLPEVASVHGYKS